jgi:hypothetical protein
MRIVCLVLGLCASSLTAAERPLHLEAGLSSHRAQAEPDDHSPATVDTDPIAEKTVTAAGSVPHDIRTSPPVAALTASTSLAPGPISTADAVGSASTATNPGASMSSAPVALPCVGCAVALQHSQGERSRLEAEKQLLTLQIDIVTLRKKLDELEAGPRPVTSGTSAPAIMAEPPPTVLSRRGFDGHFSALLRMTSGGNLVVHAGDKLPFGRIDAIDGVGVLATWYGRHVRLLDAEVDESASGAGPATRNLDLTLPVAPPAVSAR